MRKGVFYHAVDFSLGIAIVALALFLFVFYGDEPTAQEKDPILSSALQSDTTTFITTFLKTPLKSPIEGSLTGHETYGDLLFLYLEDPDHKEIYYTTFERAWRPYFFHYQEHIFGTTEYLAGGYQIIFPNGDIYSNGYQDGTYTYTLPYKESKSITIKAVLSVT